MTIKVKIRVFFKFQYFSIIILFLIIINELISELGGGNLTAQLQIVFISLQCLQRIMSRGSARNAVGQKPPLTAAMRKHFWG